MVKEKKNIVLIIGTCCMLFWILPHEYGHYFFRRRYRLETKMWGIGDYKRPIFRKDKFYIGIPNGQGINLPMDRERDKLERANLGKWRQVLVSYGGPLADLLVAICFVPFLLIISSRLLLPGCVLILFYLLVGFGNMLPFKHKDLDSDGKRIWEEVGVKYWVYCFTISLAISALVLVIMYIADHSYGVFFSGLEVLFLFCSLIFLFVIKPIRERNERSKSV